MNEIFYISINLEFMYFRLNLLLGHIKLIPLKLFKLTIMVNQNSLVIKVRIEITQLIMDVLKN
jgi:hypothetical protein